MTPQLVARLYPPFTERVYVTTTVQAVVLFQETDRPAAIHAGRLAWAETEEQALLAPVTPTLSWAGIHALSQTPVREAYDSPGAADGAMAIRRTATIRAGTRMIKLLDHPPGRCLPARSAAERILLPGARPDEPGHHRRVGHAAR